MKPRKNLTHSDGMIWLLFSLSFATLPYLKVLTGFFNIFLPIYYFPIFLSVPILLIRTRTKKLGLFLVNLLTLSYIALGYFSNQQFSLVNFKIYVAALAFVNSAYLFYILLHDNYFYSLFKEKHIKIFKILSYVFLAICFFSFIINLLTNPLTATLETFFNFLKFDRSSNIFRYQVILRFNPVGMLDNDITNIRFIGQQLLLLPLIGYILAATGSYLKKYEKIAFFVALVISSLLVNSRGVLLTVIAVSFLTSITTISNTLHRLYCCLLIAAPLLMAFLKKGIANGRHCQIGFVREHLSWVGNGIGAFTDQLNNQCSEITSDSKYNNIVTTSYDNIHIEFIHYFGIIGYVLAAGFLLRFLLRNNSAESRILGFLLFVFLTLNFNLFEFIMLPCLLFLMIRADRNSKKLLLAETL